MKFATIGTLAVLISLGLYSGIQLLEAEQPAHSHGSTGVAQGPPRIEPFFDLFVSRKDALAGLKEIESAPHPGNATMLLEMLSFLRDRPIVNRIEILLEQYTGVESTGDTDDWYKALWGKDYEPNPRYAEFKRDLYRRIDPRFETYFNNDRETTIRLDEIRWGGVVRDGIPPLKNPDAIPAEQASYLADTDVVFGVAVNGEARAYPKRILAWHEMVKDTVGGKSINGVYCTLCGSMIVYLPEFEGVHYELGTSGFLYRSNKLMYDHATESMWSTTKGEPVVGPLVGKGIKLPVHNVVTTTWGKWKSLHPDTTVLSVDTGYRRDYGEGVAYREYFATDELMFTTLSQDPRLKNKDEVFIIRHHVDTDPLALSAKFLNKNPVYHDKVADLDFVVVTDSTGANRAYASGDYRFEYGTAEDQLVDKAGGKWKITEDGLVDASGNERLERLSSHRAFWFGWFAVHPQTRLVH